MHKSSINTLQPIKPINPVIKPPETLFLDVIATNKTGESFRKELEQHLGIYTFIFEPIQDYS